MSLIQRIKETTAAVIGNTYGVSIVPQDILVNQTKPEFEGDYTVVLFALVKQLKTPFFNPVSTKLRPRR